MSTVPPIPPTYADPVLIDPVTKKGGFNPIWLNWFLTLATYLRGVATSLSDGDKGDVVVSGGGTVWVLDANVVTYAKLQDVTAESRLLGRGQGSGAGDPQEISLGTGLSMSGTTLSAPGGGYARSFLLMGG